MTKIVGILIYVAVVAAVTAGYLFDIEGARNLVLAYVCGFLLPIALSLQFSPDAQRRQAAQRSTRAKRAAWAALGRMVYGYGIVVCVWHGAGWTATAWIVAVLALESARVEIEERRAAGDFDTSEGDGP